MTLLLIIGLALTALSVFLILRALGFARGRSAAAVDNIDAYGFTGRTEAVLLRSRRLKARTSVDDYVTKLGEVVSRRFRGLDNEHVRRELVGAGLYSLSPRKFAGYRAISAVGVPALCVWALAQAGLPVPLVLVVGVVSVLIGWRLPRILVQSRGRRRQNEIDYQLPELIDLLVVTVEAGVGFTGSLRIAGDRIGGVLGEELGLTMQEQTMGLTTNEALANLLERVETPGMRSFIRSILQGERLGVSIGQILRTVAIEMRKRRRAIAEERAQKAPIKILFPLVFMIFPAIFVIILAPAVYALLDALAK
jgi:tight adherence protein C